MSTEVGDIAKASARGTFFLFIGKTSSTIIMAVASILVARLLGPENYGRYTMALIVPSFFVVLSDLGISAALIRFSARFRSEGRYRKVVGLVKAGIIAKLGSSLLLSIVLLLLSQSIATWVLKRPSTGLLVRFTSLYLVGAGVFMTLNSVFIGLDRTENSSLLMNTHAITKAVASPLLIIFGMSAIGAILGAGLGVLLAAGLGVTMLLLRICPSLVSGNLGKNIGFFQALRLMAPYGIPLYLSSLILSLLPQYQRFTLALFVSDMEIGNYTTAMNFSVLISLITYPIATSLFPAFSKLSIKECRDRVEEMFKFSLKYISLLVIPASVVMAVLSKELVYTLYGSQYQLAPSYLALYVLSFLYCGLGMFVVGSFFDGQGDTKITLRINLMNLGLTVPLAFTLTYFFGVPGLIVSFLVSQFLSSTYGLFLVHKKYAVTMDWASSFRTGLASLTSALLVYILITFAPIPTSVLKLAAGGSLFVGSFLVFAPFFGVINKVDIRNLDKLLSGLAPIYPIARRILKLEEKILALKPAICSFLKGSLDSSRN